MMRRTVAVVAVVALLVISGAEIGARDDGLLTRARNAAGGVDRFHRIQSMELKATFAASWAPGLGAVAMRIKLPDKFAVVERNPGERSRVFTAALDGNAYAATLADVDLGVNDKARRQMRYRFVETAMSYLLYLPGSCSTTPTLSGFGLSVDRDCGGFRVAFDPSTFALREMSYEVTVIEGGAQSATALPEQDGTKRPDDRPGTKQTSTTEYSNHRKVDGWLLPFTVTTARPGSKTTFSVASVRLNAAFTDEDFRPGRSLSELQEWIASAVR